MQEYQVTAGGKTYPLDLPFFVLATQNPIEQEGTYPLPEAQLDRFMFMVMVDYPTPGRGAADRQDHHDGHQGRAGGGPQRARTSWPSSGSCGRSPSASTWWTTR